MALARRIGAQIVSCDAMTVYREPRIIVNKPSPEDRIGIVHHMLDLVSVTERYDAAQFCKEVTAVVDRQSTQSPLILCGGSGLYVRTLMDGMFDDDVSEEVRALVAGLYADG